MFEPGTETSNVDGVMDGQIDDFLKAYLMMMGQRRGITYFF
jgi:peptide chain release factor 2